MYLPRPLLRALLLAGVLFGFGSELHHAHERCQARRAAAMQAWASACASAAKNPGAPVPPPPPGW